MKIKYNLLISIFSSCCGIYNLKIILDKNKNNIWDKGNFSATILPEKVFIYKEKINLRENWTLELDCIIN